MLKQFHIFVETVMRFSSNVQTFFGIL